MHPSWRGLAALLLVLLLATASQAAGQPRFTVANAQGPVPLNVTFHDVSDVPGVAARTWDFGDGTNGTERDPVHAYTVPGSYTVTLKLATANGTTSFQMANVVAATGIPTPTPSPAPLALALAGVALAAVAWHRRSG